VSELHRNNLAKTGSCIIGFYLYRYGDCAALPCSVALQKEKGFGWNMTGNRHLAFGLAALASNSCWTSCREL